MPSSYNRRKFLTGAGMFTLGTSLLTIDPAIAKAIKTRVGAADKVRVCRIGARGR